MLQNAVIYYNHKKIIVNNNSYYFPYKINSSTFFNKSVVFRFLQSNYRNKSRSAVFGECPTECLTQIQFCQLLIFN